MILSEKQLLKISLCASIIGITILFAIATEYKPGGAEEALASKQSEPTNVLLKGTITKVERTKNTHTIWISTNIAAKAVIFNNNIDNCSDNNCSLRLFPGEEIIISGKAKKENNTLVIESDEIIAYKENTTKGKKQ